MQRITNGSYFSRHLKENIWLYFFVTLFFAIGLSVGAFMSKSLETKSKQDILLYLNNFFQILNNENVEMKTILLKSIKNNFQILVLLWLFSVTYIGIPFIFLIDSFKGFVLGFTISFCFQTMGIKGLLFIILAVLPQNLIYVPCILFASVVSIQHGFSLIKKNVATTQTSRNGFLEISLIMLIIFLIMLVGSLYEGLLSPFFIKKLSNFFIIQ